jgi:hypothetical protein
MIIHPRMRSRGGIIVDTSRNTAFAAATRLHAVGL